VFERLMDRLRRIKPRGQGLCAGDGAGPALNGLPAGPSRTVHRNLCTSGKRQEARNFARDRAGSGF
jgi:hypothetical protein